MPGDLFFSCDLLVTCVLKMSGKHKSVGVLLETKFNAINKSDNSESIKNLLIKKEK